MMNPEHGRGTPDTKSELEAFTLRVERALDAAAPERAAIRRGVEHFVKRLAGDIPDANKPE